MPPNTKKTVLDAWNGYHSVPIHEDDRHFTTFITPCGRYRYKTAPQGYIASGDGYTRRYDEIVADIPNKTKCIDDVLLWSDSLEDSFFQTAQWLYTCGENGIILNPDKFIFGEDVVEFAGFEITQSNVRPSSTYLQAIKHFPTPSNITDIRSWFGLVNQVSYAFSMTEKMLPFRELLKPGVKFKWDEHLDKLFNDSKSVIISEIEEGVKIFDRNKVTCLSTDWSKDGIGFWLFQKHCECKMNKPFCCPEGWKIVLVGSRFTHSAEARYAPIEGEALAVADALDKARYFVLGCDKLILAVDHKPLLKILGNRSLEDIPNSRLRNLKEKTLRNRFTVVHIPGVKHKAADCVSRHPTGLPEKLILSDDIATINNDTVDNFLMTIRLPKPSYCHFEEDLIAASISTLDNFKSVTWERVRIATSSDETMNELLSMIESGLPENRREFPQPLQEYFQFSQHLSSLDGVILYKDRIVIPPSLRNEVLDSLHSAHQGVTAMIARAESSVFWPGITPAINDVRSKCNHCNRIAPSNPSAPPTPLIDPDYPFQCICADFFHYKGLNYLVIVDRYSNWPIVERSQNGSSGLINSLRRTFVTYGIPEEMSSDGGPEFTASDTRQFLKDWGVHHRLSSVAFPHSNCRAEIGVKSIKRLLADNTGSDGNLETNALQRAILQYRNAPDRDTKLSPAMCVFGHPIRDFIPIPPGKYKPHNTWRETLEAREEALRIRHMKESEKWSEHTKRLPPLIVGDHVRVQNQIGQHPLKWDKTGTIIEVRQFDQYVVRMDGSGRVTLRNRKFLRKYLPVKTITPTKTTEDDILAKKSWVSIPSVLPQDTKLETDPAQTNTGTTPASDIPIIHGTSTGTGTLDTPIAHTESNTPNTPNGHLIQKVNEKAQTLTPKRLSFGIDTPRSPDMSRCVSPTTSATPAPSEPRRSTRTVRPPKWHMDYDTT